MKQEEFHCLFKENIFLERKENVNVLLFCPKIIRNII